MKKYLVRAVVGCAVALSLIAASAPVAIRVEVDPIEISTEGTRVEVTVQIAPVDRSRIGSNAMVRIALTDGPHQVAPQLWAVRVGTDGTARVDVEWPPGTYRLEVRIEDPSGSDSGTWVGRVEIPGLSSTDSAKRAQEEAEPEPEPEEPATEVAPTIEEPTSGESDMAATGSPPGERPAVQEPTVAPAAGEPAPPPAEIAESAPQVREEVSPEVEFSAEGAVEEPRVPSEPRPADSEVVVIQPIADGTTVRGASAQTASAGSGPKPRPADLPRPGPEVAEWAVGEPDELELTIIVTRNDEPVGGLTPDDLILRIDEARAPIIKVGAAGDAPLALGVAVHTAPESADLASVGRRLGPFVDRVANGWGQFFVTSSGEDLVWQKKTEEFAELMSSLPPRGRFAETIDASLDLLASVRGRKFLLVLTDGRGETTKQEWADVFTSTEMSGVPILIAALWDTDFSPRTRKNLRRLADLSGGSLFMIQGMEQLDGVAERYGRILDAGVVLRFAGPASPGTSPRDVEVAAVGPTTEVRHPVSVQ